MRYLLKEVNSSYQRVMIFMFRMVALTTDVANHQSELIAHGADIVLTADNNEQLGHAIKQIANTELYIRNLQIQI